MPFFFVDRIQPRGVVELAASQHAYYCPQADILRYYQTDLCHWYAALPIACLPVTRTD